VGHASVSAPSRPTGSAALMHIVALACAVLVPVLMLLGYLESGDDSRSAWKLFERLDIVALIFCVLAAVLIASSLLIGQRRSLLIAAAMLLFATFGLLLAFVLELPAQEDGVSAAIGGYLAPLVALIGGGASVFAAEQATTDDKPALAGAGRGPDPTFTTPIGGGAAPPQGQPVQPAAGGGTQPGYYPDPYNQARLRYFDGNEWTQQTSN
jgi:hypothetical protein